MQDVPIVYFISLAQAKPCVTKSWMEPTTAVVDLTLGASSGASVTRRRYYTIAT